MQARNRGLLEAAGYAVVEREASGIFEVFALRVAERWRGWGLSPDDAYENLFAEMLPSHLAQLLAAAPERFAAPALPVAAPKPAEPEAVALPEVPEEQAPVAPRAAVVEALVAEAVQEDPAPSSLDEDVNRIRALLEVIDEESLAVLAPEIQRIEVTGIAASARALRDAATDRHGPQDALERAVAAVIGRLADLCKRFWPGSVRALQRAAGPQDARLPGQPEPETWDHAAALAQAAYDAAVASFPRLGLDATGYADTPVTMAPEPRDPAGLLAEVEARIASWSAAGSDDDPALLDAARTLRRLRGRVHAVRWAEAMGTLRRIPAAPEPLLAVLQARYVTPVPWAQIVDLEAAETAAPPADAERLPAIDATDAALVGWFERQLDAWNGPTLAAMVAPLRDRFVALAARDTFPEVADARRFRRRLRDVVARLQTVPAAPAAPVPAVPEEEAADSDATGLLAGVLPHTAGKRVILISNKFDGDLADGLKRMLALGAIVVCDGSPRRIQSACESIRQGRYDLVLGVTGFMSHACDTALVQAAGIAGTRIVRVNRGRPAACLRALAREHGVAS